MTDRAPYLDSGGEGTAGVVVVAPVSKQLGTRFDEKKNECQSVGLLLRVK